MIEVRKMKYNDAYQRNKAIKYVITLGDKTRYLTEKALIELQDKLNKFVLHNVSESTYPKEFVHLAKGNYLDKDGSIKEAQTMKDHLGNEYFMVAKDKLYSR